MSDYFGYYLKKVVVKGLFGIYDFEWNLNEDVNVLSGANGSGKSTLLESIKQMLTKGDIPKKYTDRFSSLELFFANQQSVDFNKIEIEGTIKELEEKSKTDENIRDFLIDFKNKDPTRYKNINSISAERQQISFAKVDLKASNFEELIKQVKTFDTKLKPLELLKMVANSDDVETDLDFSIYQLQKSYGDYKNNLQLQKDVLLENFPENFKEKYDEINSLNQLFFNIIDDLLSETGKKVNRKKPQLEFLLGDKEITAYQLSSGEKQLLIILMTVLVQDNKPAILLLDEPEVSLHIDWQIKLIRYIRTLNPNVQIILATHAPSVIEEGWSNKVFELSHLTMHKRG